MTARPPRDLAGSALLAVLLTLTVLAFLAVIATSLAAISRRSARGALDAVTGEAAVEEGLATPGPPVPATPGATMEVGLAPPPPGGWVGRRMLTRLAGGLVMVRATVERRGTGGVVLARSEGISLWLIGDSGSVTRAPGGWVLGP
jgi:hypothetical protein